MNDSDDAATRVFTELVSAARADPDVLGLVLHGSRTFAGMATGRSDYDVFLITNGDAKDGAWASRRTAELDLEVTSPAGFRSTVLDSGGENRYVFTHAQVLLDRLDGQVAAVIAEAAELPDEDLDRLPVMLDGYINAHYRSIKNGRDGRDLPAHLDAANSVRVAIWVIFALHRRVRPYNKYLAWELQRHPLGDPEWDADRLLPRIQTILTDADQDIQRDLFRDIEAAARAAGLGDTVDGWGDDLRLLR